LRFTTGNRGLSQADERAVKQHRQQEFANVWPQEVAKQIVRPLLAHSVAFQLTAASDVDRHNRRALAGLAWARAVVGCGNVLAVFVKIENRGLHLARLRQEQQARHVSPGATSMRSFSMTTPFRSSFATLSTRGPARLEAGARRR